MGAVVTRKHNYKRPFDCDLSLLENGATAR